MLRSLYIKNFALIEELEVNFGSGLNIITGETGAGKSILLGALKLILGERASTEFIRTGEKKSIIEGHFDAAGRPDLVKILQDNDIDAQPILILRREVSQTQSRAFINDTPVTAKILQILASMVIDLHGQHQHQSLLRTETHVHTLDNFGGLGNMLATYKKQFDQVNALRREWRDLQAREDELKREKELFSFQINEIEQTNPLPGEEEKLEAEERVLANAEKLFELTNGLHELMYDKEDSLYDQLVRVRNGFQNLARIDHDFDASLAEIESAEITISETTQFLQDYNSRIEFNPERLATIRQRLDEFENLKRKYGSSINEVLAYKVEIEKTVQLAQDFEGALTGYKDRIDQAQTKLSSIALRLSKKRRQVAKKVEKSIVAELATIGMPNAQFKVAFNRKNDECGWLSLQTQDNQTQNFWAYTTGAEKIEFLISANPGEEIKPLAKVASGGEISRIMLAMKSILAKSDRLPILVFDEIDTGISGIVARKVGRSMHRLGEYHQIIAITHLPQIASLGDSHFKVEKQVETGRTFSRIRKLDGTQRASEVAALLGGGNITDATLQSAWELITEFRPAE